MNKTKKLLVPILALLALLVIVLFLVGFFKPKGAGLLIQTTPLASVYIDGKQVGRTPYNAIYEPGEKVIKLVPDSFELPLTPYETMVNLTSGVETVITREFKDLEDTSSGEIVSFERVGKTETSLAVLSQPDGAQVKIDGVIRGFAPFKTTDVSQGEYTLSLTAPGFSDRSIKIKTYEGYMLTVIVKLAKSDQIVIEEDKDELEIKTQTEIEILSTPTNFLRVRSDASSGSEEIGKVIPGETYVLLEESEDGEWHKISYEEGKDGWVSTTYTKILDSDSKEDEANLTPQPTSAN
ncbi:PEGA domain-containing protein [Candidatus Woesebacteria bacterium]|nr:MAG: PEGA domain-containing protein [Candidatus Woesebacteria bacterium]